MSDNKTETLQINLKVSEKLEACFENLDDKLNDIHEILKLIWEKIEND